MSIVCPDTMVIVSIVTKERGWRQWERRLTNTDEKVLLRPVLRESAKRCAQNYFEVAKALRNKRKRKWILDKYEPGGAVHNAASLKEPHALEEYLNQIVPLGDLVKDIPVDLFGLLSKHRMKIFPFGSECAVLENPQERQLEIKDIITKATSLATQEALVKELESDLQHYSLGKYLAEARRSLARSWPRAENDRFLLATYLRARETAWPTLNIMTSDKRLKSALRKCPTKFSFC